MLLREVQAKLQGKIGLVSEERGSHTHFHLTGPARSNFPTILSLSRGSGELSHRNKKGLAAGLGLRLGEFEDCISCNISGNIVLLALTVYLMLHIHRRRIDDPVVYGRQCSAMNESVCYLLDQVESGKKVTAKERLILDRLLLELQHDFIQQLNACRKRTQRLIKELLGPSAV
jgi:hypothetical protein